MARRTHCPAGRPLFREVPEHLATVTMLKHRRLRVAAGQKPVASLLYHGNEYTPLYKVAAAEPMRPLSAKRQAAFDRVRTCDRTGQLHVGPPLEVWQDRRLCGSCIEAISEIAWRKRQRVNRAECADWARGVLADPTVVLVAESSRLGGAWFEPLDVYAVTGDGQVLLDATVRNHHKPDAGGTPVENILDAIREIAHRRRVGWWTNDLNGLADEVGWSGLRNADGSWLQLGVSGLDHVGDRWSVWAGERPAEWPWRYARPGAWSEHYGWTGAHCEYMCAKRPDLPHRELVAHQIELLHRMAGGES